MTCTTRGCHGHDRMVVGLTTDAISAHLFDTHSC